VELAAQLGYDLGQHLLHMQRRPPVTIDTRSDRDTGTDSHDLLP